MFIQGRKRILFAKMFLFIIAILLVLFFILLFSLSSRDRKVLFSKERIFSFNYTTRHYLVSEPKQITKESKLIVGLHGFGDTPMRFVYYTGLHNAANENDLVIYPKASPATVPGQKPGWNAGFCCGSGWVNKIDDAGFIVALVTDLAKTYNIDASRIYVTGFSNGAFMTERLATDYPDIFQAFAPRSGSIGTVDSRLEPKTPVPMLLSHGEKDTTVPFNGGVGGSDPDFTWISFTDTVGVWKDVNGDSVETKTIMHKDDAHSWHDWRLFNFWHRTPEGSRDVVEFFNRNS